MKKRNTGDILLEMEPLILELVDQGLQHGDILALIWVYLTVHAPGAREVYTKDGSSPIMYYGPSEALNRKGK